MGIVRPDKNKRMAIEEFRKMLLSCAAVRTQKPDDRFEDQRSSVGLEENDVVQENQVVCVTSGVSFLGLAIVNQLLVRGYSVRIIVDNQDIEKLREMELSGEMRGTMSRVGVVMANLDEVESFLEAFEGCCCVYHTAAFIDPAGISGYSKSMAEIEVKATKHVIEACAITQSVRKCVLTSSLLACTWRDGSLDNLSPVINHDCWSDESLCKEKKENPINDAFVVNTLYFPVFARNPKRPIQLHGRAIFFDNKGGGKSKKGGLCKWKYPSPPKSAPKGLHLYLLVGISISQPLKLGRL